ncbi:MAG: DUF1841 family protein [Nitrosomonas sp.]|nr:DUF1841 family protein [Nitrosomonas sp.]
MFNPTRAEVRQFFFDTWKKYQRKEILSDMETIALEVILLHPEYHPMLENMEYCLEQEYPPETGVTNPFLHMSMHVAIREQLAIDQPPGIRTKFRQLCTITEDEHEAVHYTMECLAEMLWESQRNQTAPDASIYLGCMDRRIRK